jgi:hypothetical protein
VERVFSRCFAAALLLGSSPCRRLVAPTWRKSYGPKLSYVVNVADGYVAAVTAHCFF